MAEPSPSNSGPGSLRKQEDGERVRPSTGTSSHRNSRYDTQRTERRRSRTESGGSQTSSRSKGKHPAAPTYDEPFDFSNLNEIIPSGGVTPPEDPYSLEQAQESDRNSAAQSNRSSARHSENHQSGLTETAAPPPVHRSPAGAQRNSLLEQKAGDDADKESSGASPAYASRRPEDYVKQTPPPPAVPRWLTELYDISYLIFFSILGTLGRLGLQWLTYYPGAPLVTPVTWANFAGSAIMGFLAEDQGLFRDEGAAPQAGEKQEGDFEELSKAEKLKKKKAIPLYIGLATGFCGSLTSLSSFARDFFLALSNDLPTPLDHGADYSAGYATTSSTVPRNAGYSFEAWSAIVIYTLALSLGGLIFGAHVATFLDNFTPRIPTTFTRRFLDPVTVLLGFGSWLGAVFLSIWPPHPSWRGEVIFALAFAPLGCLLRFYISLHLNPIVPSFPLGTFAVNMLGTAIIGMCYDIQHVGIGVRGMTGGGRIGCQVLQGVQDGFCGCLTTVSTWVAEINGLRRQHGYVYALGTVVGGLCLMLVILGSVTWSVGFSETACNVGYVNKISG